MLSKLHRMQLVLSKAGVYKSPVINIRITSLWQCMCQEVIASPVMLADTPFVLKLGAAIEDMVKTQIR
ncbi:hypothetical protein EFK13_19670 [Bacillus cabrialesii]|uniref:hypothetical protein n=1 Tax=Bacillus cabrialesii TaxID=2487276 RepID=UPI00101259F0|nr:hypothetical protein [Bacillus cabrialesii]UQE78881.1 hypothetical protein EFK13_19670 [Bacillus cabrialesii]